MFIGTVHVGVGCVTCGNVLGSALRFACACCVDYNLCEKCHDDEILAGKGAATHASGHAFLRIFHPGNHFVTAFYLLSSRVTSSLITSFSRNHCSSLVTSSLITVSLITSSRITSSLITISLVLSI